jgi:precorrin isomerase
MLAERHYGLDSRRLYARCLNCGFWLDLADLLRFFHRVLEAGLKDLKPEATIHS